jgi:hypothetical protein
MFVLAFASILDVVRFDFSVRQRSASRRFFFWLSVKEVNPIEIHDSLIDSFATNQSRTMMQRPCFGMGTTSLTPPKLAYPRRRDNQWTSGR